VTWTEYDPAKAGYIEGAAVTHETCRQELVTALGLDGSTDWLAALAYAARAGERLRAVEERAAEWNRNNPDRVRATNREAAKRYRARGKVSP